MSDRRRFNKAFLDSAKPVEGKSRTYFYDSKVNGLVLCLTQPSKKNPQGVKSFQVYKWSKVKGRAIRVTLGTYPDMKLGRAEILATEEIASIAAGEDPNQRKKADRVKGVTLEECFKDYLAVRGKRLSVNTLSSYKTIMETHLVEWADKPLSEITRNRVASRHKSLSIDSESSANKTMRVLRALFNFAHGEYEDENGKGLFPDNPVSKLTHTKAWNEESRRQTIIKNYELQSWFKAVLKLREVDDKFSQMVSDYLVFTLLNGLRRREASNLNLEDVDFNEKTFTVAKTKNKQSLTLPMSDYSLEILKRRKGRRKRGFVFQGRNENALNDPRAAIAGIRIAAGVHFTMHDLRRTFITIAESLDISAYAVKRLVNHSLGGDVTAGYVIWDVERLRKPMQDITGFILKTADVKQSATLTSFKPIADKAK